MCVRVFWYSSVRNSRNCFSKLFHESKVSAPPDESRKKRIINSVYTYTDEKLNNSHIHRLAEKATSKFEGFIDR